MKRILDVCCGGRMFWFNKKHPDVLYVDIRTMPRQLIWQNGKQKRYFEVKPDVVMDFRKLNLPNNSFHLVVFDPPHLAKRNGKTGYVHHKYGSLFPTWKDDIRAGFSECWRVLKKNGVLIFKWSETEIPLKTILELTPTEPLFGHKSGKYQKTHWMTFMK